MCGMFVPDQSQALSLWSGSTASKTLDYQRTNPSRYQIMKESESEVIQSCATLCDPMDCSLPGFSVHGIFPARVLEWVAISFSRGSSQPRNRTRVSRVAGRRFTLWPIQRKPLEYKAGQHPTTSSTRMPHLNNKQSEVAQLYPTLWDPLDCSLPGFSVHGIFQARILECVAIFFSRKSSQPRDWTWVSCIVGRCFIIWPTREAHNNKENKNTNLVISRKDYHLTQACLSEEKQTNKNSKNLTLYKAYTNHWTKASHTR